MSITEVAGPWTTGLDVSQHAGRLEPCRPARGKPACAASNEDENGGGGDEQLWLSGGETKEQRLNELGRPEASDPTAMSKRRPISGPKKPGWVTPIIVNGTRSTVMEWPSTSGEPPKRRCQNPSLMTVTAPSAPPPGRSSASVKVRPTIAVAPSTSKNPPLTIRPSTSSV